jgi:TRAP-type C4-dicarboxylate transport system permease large subunit
MKLFAQAAMPLGVFYLIAALVYHGWFLATEGLSVSQVINFLLVVPIAIFLIWQGREWRRDPRFR